MSEETIIHRPQEALPDLQQLMAIAHIDAEVVQQAVDSWKENPPDPKFTLILEADNGS